MKNAARRKLEHELGIPPEEVPLDSFTWVTRVHYVGISGKGPWGEHEIDWILLCSPKVMPRLDLNLNEVSQVGGGVNDLRLWLSCGMQRPASSYPLPQIVLSSTCFGSILRILWCLRSILRILCLCLAGSGVLAGGVEGLDAGKTETRRGSVAVV